ncbi:MAG: SPOR domain-containing protein [bacterium]|nr:SPOR domain-containing protein [bacterium]
MIAKQFSDKRIEFSGKQTESETSPQADGPPTQAEGQLTAEDGPSVGLSNTRQDEPHHDEGGLPSQGGPRQGAVPSEENALVKPLPQADKEGESALSSEQGERAPRPKGGADKEGEIAAVASGYSVRVYSSVIKDDAEKVALSLARMSYSPKVVREPGFAMMNNVYLAATGGPASQDVGSQEMIRRLKEDGFSVYLQKNQKNQYIIRAGSCYYLESAKNLLKSLKHKGYSGNILQEKTEVIFYSVFVGRYRSFEEALEEQKQLNLKGFPMAVAVAASGADD